MATIPFTALRTATPTSPVRTCLRIDPYYDALWTDGSEASWISKARAGRTERAGLGTLPRHLAATPDDAWARLNSHKFWETKLSVLSAVDSWRTMTSEQAAQLTGQHQIASGTHRSTGDLFAASLLELGVFSSPMNPSAKQSRGTLLRPAVPGTNTDRMADLLSYPEWVSVTGGHGFEHARQFDRHNLLGTELGLRCAEYLPLGTVLGEKQSNVTALAYGAWGATPPPGTSQQTADLTIVRRDGLRIAVEITASHGPSLDAKIEKWSKVLSRRSTADSGLVVVFVVAGRPDGGAKTSAQVLRKTRQAITKSARMNPGHPDDRTASRMMLVTWADWFPEERSASDAFLTLRAERPTGDPVNPWTPVNMLDTTQLIYRPSAAAETTMAVFHNTSGLRSVAHWLRTGRAPQLWQQAMSEQGFQTLPALTGLTDKGCARAGTGIAKGAAGIAGLSSRLQFDKPAAA